MVPGGVVRLLKYDLAPDAGGSVGSEKALPLANDFLEKRGPALFSPVHACMKLALSKSR